MRGKMAEDNKPVVASLLLLGSLVVQLYLYEKKGYSHCSGTGP